MTHKQMAFGWIGLLCILVHVAHADTHSDLLLHVQAADVLSDLLTWDSRLAAARVDSLSQYLQETGKLEAFSSSKIEPPAIKGPFYTGLFAGAVQFVKDGGDKYADPSLKSLNDLQLMHELTALQSYNTEQFVYLNQKRKIAATVKAYLESIGQWDAYCKWAAEKSPAMPVIGATTKSAALSPEQMIAAMEQMVESSRQAAWKRAQAKGVSQQQFDRQWQEQLAKFKTDVRKRAEGMQALGSSLSSNVAARAPAVPNDFSNWISPYPGSFNTTYMGPGLYAAYDTRVDYDYDDRVNGEYDRRRDLGFDRRQNVFINVRRGV